MVNNQYFVFISVFCLFWFGFGFVVLGFLCLFFDFEKMSPEKRPFALGEL